jgi:hypothetical protein
LQSMGGGGGGGDGAASTRRWRGVAWSGGLGCFGPQMGVGIRWRAAARAWRAVRDMDAAWEKNSGTWLGRDEKSRLTGGPHQRQF